jgi:Na+-transporting methylmalonyl-CoA/oxaloacetate decarboxylase gamma subunit
MLKPGVSSGVFTTLKLALVGLVCTLAFMLYAIEDARVRMHLSIFLGMACILLVLVIWFVGELAKSKAEAAADKSGGKGAANAPKPTPSKKSPKKPKKVD